MRRLRFVQFDVFTREPFGGNQLAVFFDGDILSDERMQAIAREMNYSETTFILPTTDPKALCRVRIFTPLANCPSRAIPSSARRSPWPMLASSAVANRR